MKNSFMNMCCAWAKQATNQPTNGKIKQGKPTKIETCLVLSFSESLNSLSNVALTTGQPDTCFFHHRGPDRRPQLNAKVEDVLHIVLSDECAVLRWPRREGRQHLGP